MGPLWSFMHMETMSLGLRNGSQYFLVLWFLTTQGRPFENIHNFGGFSDGDRAVYMARDFGAATIQLLGFDCDDESVTPVKKGKLIWARRLLSKIGYDC